MYPSQPIVIKQTAPRRSYRRRGPSKVYKRYKRAYYNARRYRRYLQDQAGARGTPGSQSLWGVDYAAATPDQQALRRGLGFRGKGDYLTDIGKWGSRALGMGIGGFVGGIPGAALGHRYGARFSKYMGWGEYGGDAGGNQIMAGSTQTPMTVNASDDLSGDVYFSNREFLGNVTATATGTTTPSSFNIVAYPLNSGLITTFPWLSQIAQNYTLYEFEGCIFEYKPTSGELGSASNALGKVVMATQYDPDAPNFTSAVEMENYAYNDACKPSEHMLHGVETLRSQAATNMLYVRTGPTSKDKIFTDYGTFQIATEGLPLNATAGTTVNVGELWVSYRIKLSRPKLYGSLLNLNSAFDSFWFRADGTTVVGDTNAAIAANNLTKYPSNNPVNTAAPRITNNIGCAVGSTTRTSMNILFPSNIVAGVYRISFEIDNAAPFTMVFNAPTVTNGSLVAAQGIDGQPFQATFSTSQVFAASGFSAQTFIVSINAPGNLQSVVTISWTNNIPSASIGSIVISDVPASILS